MKNRVLQTAFLTGAFALAVGASAAEEDVMTKPFSSKAGGKLIMNVDRGSIDIKTHSGNTVDVKVVRRINRVSAARAKEIFTEHVVEMTESGEGVKITAEFPGRKGFNFGFNNPANRLQAEYTVSVPSRYNLEVRTAGGNIGVADLQGDMDCHTSGGDLNFGTIKGSIKGHTSGGSVRLQSGTGDINVHTSGGDIRIANADGDLTAKTSGGTISLDRTRGNVRAETSGGDIRVKDSLGPLLARTSGGSVTAQLVESPKGECTLRTSGGDVEVTLPESATLTLAARTSGGSVNSDFPGDFNKERNRLNAKLNGGGPEMLLETSGGSIRVRKGAR